MAAVPRFMHKQAPAISTFIEEGSECSSVSVLEQRARKFLWYVTCFLSCKPRCREVRR
jgi:hypothetical protein